MLTFPYRMRVCAAAGLLGFILHPSGLRAQSADPLPVGVGVAIEDDNGDGVPDRLGQRLTLSGRINAEPRLLLLRGRPYAAEAGFQDDTGGLVLFTREESVLGGVKRGDRVEVTGTLAQHNGREELIVDTLKVTPDASPLLPREVLAFELKGERYSGQLVRLVGTLIRSVNFPEGGQGLRLRDRSGEVPVWVPESVLAQPDLVDRLQNGMSIALTGVAEQRDTIPPFDSGYGLRLRDAADLRLPARRPLPRWFFPLIGLAAAMWGLMILLGRLKGRRQAREVKRLSESLRKSEDVLALNAQRFRALIEKSSDSITLLRPDGRVLYSAGAGVPNPDEPGGAPDGPVNFFDPMHPGDLPRVKRVMAELSQRPGGGGPAQYRVRSPDGGWRWMEATVTNLLEDPAVGAIVVNSRDVSARKLAEAKLRHSEERFSKAFHSSPIAISIATLTEGRFIDANESFLKLVGFEREELLGQTASDLEIWVDQADRTRIVDRLVHQGSMRGAEVKFRARSGETREAVAAFELIELGGERCILCLVQDVTEHRGAQEAARVSQERFQLIARATNDTIWDWDLKTNQVWWNEGIKTLFGYSPETIHEDGNWWDEHIHPEDRERVLSEMQRVIASGGHYWSAEYRYRRADGSYADVFDRGYVLHDDQGRATRMIGAMMDMTDRKRFERDLAAARDEALESVRLKTEFLANISHEVRTPLNGIVGMTVLLRDTRLNAQQRGFAETIQTSADALMTIINDILDFSRIEAGKLHFETLDFDLRLTVQTTVEMLVGRAQHKHVELITRIGDDVPVMLRGDPGRLRQIITNLMVNAIKFTEEGEVVLRVVRDAETSTHATLCFSIADTGIGIPQEALPHLFQAFSQADGSTTRKYGGTGLGLVISKQLVEMMGGQVGVESQVGSGSTFWFTVTLEKQPNAAVAPALPRPKLAGLKLLVVSDNEPTRKHLDDLLTELRLRAEDASSSQEALRVLTQAADAEEPYALALLDMQTSGLDSVAFTRAINADPRTASTRLLLITPSGPRSDTAVLRANGIGAFLVKPVDRTQLIDSLNRLMSTSFQHETRFWLNRKKDPAPESQPRVPRESLHILVAEDNAINQRVAIGLLGKLGYRAEAVANGLEVLKAVELVAYHIILMDCQLPELDGYRTTMAIRKREAEAGLQPGQGVYIIAMTAHAVPGAREKCLAAGMNDYISKPVYLEALQEALEKAAPSIKPPEPASPVLVGSNGSQFDPEALKSLRALREPHKPDPVREVIGLFISESRNRLDELRTAAADHDSIAIEILAHRLRGIVGSVGAKRMGELSAQLEEYAHVGAVKSAAAVLDQIEQEFEVVKKALESETAV